jgi:hypothetical protein
MGGGGDDGAIIDHVDAPALNNDDMNGDRTMEVCFITQQQIITSSMITTGIDRYGK